MRKKMGGVARGGGLSPVPDAPRSFAVALLLVSTAIICAATLTSRTGGGGTPSGCLFICGPRGLADAVANILLFAPFGLALGLLKVSGWRGMLIGMLFSIGIETAQLWVVTGRDSTPADVVSNALGALLGASLGYRWFQLLLPGKVRAARLLLMAGIGIVGSGIATGLLLAPGSPDLDYYGQWTEAHGGFDVYRGEVLAASIGDERVGAFEAPVSVRARGLLEEGVPLRADIQVGPAPDRTAMLLAISRGASRLVLILVDGQDLIVRYFGESLDLALDGPSFRMVDGLAGFSPGDEATLSLRRIREGYCLEVGGREQCTRFSVANGWNLLQDAAAYPAPAARLISAIWMGILAFPLGLWYRRSRMSTAIVVLTIGSVALMPLAVPLVALSVLDLIGALVGGALGYGIRRWAGHHYGMGGYRVGAAI